jgi:hypothetical protein
MKFETIIVLVIAYNVVMAVLKSRARKAKAESEASPNPPQRAVAPAEQIRKTNSERKAAIPQPPAVEASKPRGLGKDLLDQLAKELGLPLPSSTPAKPVPAKTRPLPVSETSRIPKAMAAIPVSGLEQTALEGNPAVTQKRDPIGPLPRLATQLRDRNRVQEAFMLREILDPPLALRRKHP